MGFRIGKVTHYYDKMKMAVVELDADLTIGEPVRFVYNGVDLFTETIVSIQIEHEKVSHAKKGDTVGIKCSQKVPNETQIYREN